MTDDHVVLLDAHATLRREATYWRKSCAVAWYAGVAVGMLLGAITYAIWMAT